MPSTSTAMVTHASTTRPGSAASAIGGAVPPGAEALAQRGERRGVGLDAKRLGHRRVARRPRASSGGRASSGSRPVLGHFAHSSTVTVERLNAMWATMAGPSRPVRITR